MTRSTVTSKGQVTIPKAIKMHAMIHKGTQLDFQIQNDGTILIFPLQRHISQLKGIIKSKRMNPVTFTEMNNAISNGAQEAFK